MKALFKNIENFIIVSNGKIVSKQLSDGILATDDEGIIITIGSGVPTSLQVIMEDIKKDSNVFYNIEKNSTIKVVELHRFTASSIFKRKVEIQDNAKVNFLSLNEGRKNIDIIIDEYWKVGRDALVHSSYGEVSESNITATYFYDLLKEGSQTNIKMAALAMKQQHKSFQISLHHDARNTFGEMENYGVASQQGRLLFEGIGRIEKGMSLSSSHQTSKIMVFDEESVATVNPLLYIEDYDVKASHAAGVGRMDQEQLYYLQSRGLNKAEAMHLITMGYLLPIVETMQDEELTAYFVDTLEKKVGK